MPVNCNTLTKAAETIAGNASAGDRWRSTLIENMLYDLKMVERQPGVRREEPRRELLHGAPPKYITIARRRGDEWFVGSITDWDARDIDAPLSFLGSGAYDAEIYADGPNAATQLRDSVVEKRRATSAGGIGPGSLAVDLRSGGGYVARLKR